MMEEMADGNAFEKLPDGMFLHALENCPVAIMITSFKEEQSEELQINYINDAFKDLLKFTKGKTLQENPIDLFRIANNSLEKSEFVNSLISGKTSLTNLFFQTITEQLNQVGFKLTVYDDKGKQLHLWMQHDAPIEEKGLDRSVTQREYLSRLFNESEEIVFCISPSADVIFANKAFSHLTGKDELNVRIMKILDNLITTEDREAHEAFDGAVQGIQQTFLAGINSRDNVQEWFNFTATPLIENGIVQSVYFVGRIATQEQLNQRHEILINEIIRRFEKGKNLHIILAEMLDLLCDKFGWECGEIWMPDQIMRRSKLFAWSYPRSPEFDEFLAISSSEEISSEFDHALKTRSGKALLHKATHLFLEDNFPRKSWAEKAGLKVGFSMPIFLGDSYVALISFLATEKQDQFSNDIISIVRLLTLRIGVYIERHRIAYDFEQVFELVPDFLCVLDASGRFYKANKQLRETLGEDDISLQSRSFMDFVEEDYEETTLGFLQKLKSEYLVRYENVFEGLKGDVLLEWSMSFNPVEGVIYGAAKDVTMRVKYDEELRKSAERFTLVSEATNDVIYEWDPYSDRVMWTDNFIRMFGYSNVDVLQTDGGWTNFIHPADKDRVINNINSCKYHKQRLWSDEYRYLCADGSYKSILDRGIFLYNDKGINTRIIGAMQDITPLKESEETLIKLNDAMQYRARQLQGFNKELEQFAYIVSHDLQEPLRMISSFMQLLQNSEEIVKSEKSELYISFAIDGALRMKRLIQDLLTYSRIGTTEEDFQIVDLGVLVRDTIVVYQQSIREKGAEIIIEPLPSVRAIQSLMGQIFHNLISNALKYNQNPKPRIEISYSESSTHHIICVEDNGIGIDPKYFDLIYVPFKRLHNKNEYSGTGIGLAICKKITDKHQGQIWVESKPAVGSKFFFSIQK
jgi:PAS domain S-box-containing protein